MDRLNVFNVYKDKELNHEDVLTRSFLILLKNISAVQAAFFELIRNKMPDIGLESFALGKLSISEIYTQTTSNGLLKGKQEYKILSVVISDDEYSNSHVVQESSRNARYDGVVICDPSWIFIIENKPYVGNVWEGQLDPNEEDVKGNELIAEPCCLSWRDIIEIMNSLLEHNISSLAEKSLIEDFFEYINTEYVWLNPYSDLSLCQDNKWLMDRRCGEILKKVFESKGKELYYHKGWKHYIDTSDIDGAVKEIALDSSEDSIVLWMYGGDTMVSARKLYEQINIDNVKKLCSEQFIVKPNFHISYRGTGLIWFDTSISLFEYIDYWKKNEPKQKKHDELFIYYKELVERMIINQDDETINERIINKKYPNLNICPGLFFGFKWSIEEAKKSDKMGLFIEDVRDKIKQIQSAYLH